MILWVIWRKEGEINLKKDYQNASSSSINKRHMATIKFIPWEERQQRKKILDGQKENFTGPTRAIPAGTMGQEISSQLRGYSWQPVQRRSLVLCQNQLSHLTSGEWFIWGTGVTLFFDLLVLITSYPSEPTVRFKSRAQAFWDSQVITTNTNGTGVLRCVINRYPNNIPCLQCILSCSNVVILKILLLMILRINW